MPMIPNPINIESKWKLWTECLGSADRNSIQGQLWEMHGRTAAFKAFNKAKQLATPTKGGGVELNALLFHMFDNGYFESQCLAIRRLTDSYPLDGHRGVWSLKSLILDMKANVSLLTRESVLKMLKVDPDVGRIKSERATFEARQPMGQPFYVPRELNWERSEAAHKVIDRMCQVDAGHRAASDTFEAKFFESILSELEQSVPKDISAFVDKFIAHASTSDSRSAKPISEKDLTFGMVWNAERVLSRVFNAISTPIFEQGPTMLPHAAFDQFKYIENPIATLGNVKSLREEWSSFEKEVEGWGEWAPCSKRKHEYE